MLNDEKVNLLSTLVKYHEDVNGFINLYGTLKKKPLPVLLEELKTYTDNNLIKHFLLEEIIVFPCILQKMPSNRATIEKYLKEHQEIRSELYRIICTGGDNLAEGAEEVLKKLLRHILDEDKNIVKLVKTHSHLMLLMGREYLLNKEKLQAAPSLFIRKD